MGERVLGIRVKITRYVSDEPQPGLVACEFADADGRVWTFTEKTAMVCMEPIDGSDAYPRPGAMMGRIVGRRRDEAGRERIAFEAEFVPDGDTSFDSTKRYEVDPGSLVEWEWGESGDRPWDGRE